MKTTKKLFVALLAIAMLFALAACGVKPDDTCTVTFKNGKEVYKTVEVNKGEKLTLPKAPKGESGKGLRGWSTIDGDIEEIIDPAAYVVEADVTLYAIWADVYTVVINFDNGTPFIIEEVFAGAIISQPEDPVKEGYKFIEWRNALKEVPYDFSQPVYSDLTIKAMYGDGSPNRVTETKWDFTLGHGSWYGGQGAWGRVENGIDATDMVFETTEDGYAAWGFTLADAEGNIPTEITGGTEKGFGMKFLYNEGISVDAAKAKLVVAYVKPKYFPMDMYGDMNDQFRISILTGNGGMIYGYGSGCEDWAIHSAGANKDLVQADIMEDGWIRVQFKIHELKVWSEDTVLKSFSIAVVQRPSTPIMDIISFKSIELLDQEEFIDPHTIDYVTKTDWDMTKEEDVKDWTAAQGNGSNTTSVKTTIDANGTTYQYTHSNAWRGITLTTGKIDISKCSGIFSATIDISGMTPTNYRLYIVTGKDGEEFGDLYKNTGRDDVSCYYVATPTDELGEGWTVTPNADGTITVSYDMTKLEYWNIGTELLGLTFVTVDKSATGTVIYKSISLTDTVKTHNCETDGHIWNDATCDLPKTCAVCGVTEGEAAGHSWVDATCQAPKTCSACGAKEGTVADHTFVEGVCSVCGEPEVAPVIKNSWDMANAEDSANWYSAQNKNVLDKSSIAVTENGSVVTYTDSNAWKGIRLENALIDMNKLTGKLSFTYSTALSVSQYRIYVLTDKGGDLVYNDEPTSGFAPANYYVAMKVTDIAEGTAWTRTENADGSVTVTFDLTSLPFYAEGATLKGLTIVTVAGSTGDITYKSIAIEQNPPIVWDMKDAEDSAAWHASQDKGTKETATMTVNENGTLVSYSNSNGWKGMTLKDQEINIAKQQGTLSFTYSTALTISSYRIYVLSDLGGHLTHNDEATAGTAKANFYNEIKPANIADNEYWTSTVNEDGTVTVTFDLTAIPFYKDGATLKGLTIVTVASGTGDITYNEIAIN